MCSLFCNQFPSATSSRNVSMVSVVPAAAPLSVCTPPAPAAALRQRQIRTCGFNVFDLSSAARSHAQGGHLLDACLCGKSMVHQQGVAHICLCLMCSAATDWRNHSDLVARLQQPGRLLVDVLQVDGQQAGGQHWLQLWVCCRQQPRQRGGVSAIGHAERTF
jgi:hypothetical protein